jgi:hypothetical protein
MLLGRPTVPTQSFGSKQEIRMLSAKIILAWKMDF